MAAAWIGGLGLACALNTVLYAIDTTRWWNLGAAIMCVFAALAWVRP